MARFEVGKMYEALDSGITPIKVVKRTKHFITATVYDTTVFRMKIRHAHHGDAAEPYEFAYESCVGEKWRDAFTYDSRYEV